ncbi:MAG: AI-2E family transporter [Eubacteriales bacterium]|nr:AI-2E family transporter [Eubacteriales bacterium]
MDFNKKNIKIIIGILFGGIFFHWCLQHLNVVGGVMGSFMSLISPFVLGATIAFIINVPMHRLENCIFGRVQGIGKLKRPLSYIITLILVTGIISIAMYIIIPELANTMQMIAKQIPFALDTAQKFIESKLHYLSSIQVYTDHINIDWDDLAKKAAAVLQSGASSLIDSGVGAVSGIVNGVATFLIGFVFSIYLLMQKEKLGFQGKQVLFAILPKRIAERILYILSLANTTFSKFLSGQCLEAVILGTLFFISMTVFKMPYALLISVLIAISALIPIVGAFIGCFVGALLILIINPWKAFMFIIMFLVLQQIEGNLIYPHVVGNSVGLPSIWVLVAVTLGGKLMGVMGMLIFIPLCSVAYAIFRAYIKEQLDIKKIYPEVMNE